MLKKTKKLAEDLTVTGMTLGVGTMAVGATGGSTAGLTALSGSMGTVANVGMAGVLVGGVSKLSPKKKKK